MTYRLDPQLVGPYNRPSRALGADRDLEAPGAECDRRSSARVLLDALGIHGQDVEEVRVKRVVVEFTMRDDC